MIKKRELTFRRKMICKVEIFLLLLIIMKMNIFFTGKKLNSQLCNIN